jgi:uncharacterized damage-inducible protein DinB
MKNLILRAALSAMLICCVGGVVSGQEAAGGGQMAAGQAADKTAPSYDMKAQAALDLGQLQKKFVSLAEAMPAEKFTWRPAEGVRSISELYLHVAASNYGILTMMGAAVPSGVDNKGMEKSTTDKAKIVAELNKSFANAISVVNGMTNAEFAKAQPKLGPDANSGDVIYILVTHLHEHMGQAIANARANGIVPPWTVEAMKKAAEKNTEAPKE